MRTTTGVRRANERASTDQEYIPPGEEEAYVTLGFGVGLPPSDKAVISAYREAARRLHPDRGGDEESFRLLSKAYDVLSDSERRKYYERTGRPERTAEDDFLDGFGKKSVETPKRDESAALAQRLDASRDESHAKSFEAWMRSRRPRRLCCWRLRETASPSTCRQRVYVNLTWSRR